MIEIVAVLGLPIAGALLLAVVGEREQAPTVNVASRLDIPGRGGADRARDPRWAAAGARSAVLRRSVQRVPGRADCLRRLHDVDLFAAVHAHRGGTRPPQRGAAAALPRDVPALQLHDAARPADQQHGHPLGCAGGRDADHGAAGVALPHAGEPRSGMENSSSAGSASRKRCSARSFSTSPRKSFSVPRVGPCCGPNSTASRANSSQPCCRSPSSSC